jgi:hypothetical protein
LGHGASQPLHRFNWEKVQKKLCQLECEGIPRSYENPAPKSNPFFMLVLWDAAAAMGVIGGNERPIALLSLREVVTQL